MKELWGTDATTDCCPRECRACLMFGHLQPHVSRRTNLTHKRTRSAHEAHHNARPPRRSGVHPHTESRDTLRVGPQTLRTSHPPLLSSTRPAIPPPSHRHAHRRGKPTRSGGAALVHVQSPRSHNPQSPLFDGPAARAACFQPSCRRALDVRTSLMRHLMRP